MKRIPRAPNENCAQVNTVCEHWFVIAANGGDRPRQDSAEGLKRGSSHFGLVGREKEREETLLLANITG